MALVARRKRVLNVLARFAARSGAARRQRPTGLIVAAFALGLTGLVVWSFGGISAHEPNVLPPFSGQVWTIIGLGGTLSLLVLVVFRQHQRLTEQNGALAHWLTRYA
ncbi:MAG: hypothetical protein ACJ8AW_21905 [Rhodopila sp.]